MDDNDVNEKAVEICHMIRIWAGGAKGDEARELAQNVRELAEEIAAIMEEQ